jgi:hypothetical protein
MSDLNHDAVMRIGGRLLGGGPFYRSGTTARMGFGAPPPRIVKGAQPVLPIGAKLCFALLRSLALG